AGRPYLDRSAPLELLCRLSRMAEHSFAVLLRKEDIRGRQLQHPGLHLEADWDLQTVTRIDLVRVRSLDPERSIERMIVQILPGKETITLRDGGQGVAALDGMRKAQGHRILSFLNAAGARDVVSSVSVRLRE